MIDLNRIVEIIKNIIIYVSEAVVVARITTQNVLEFLLGIDVVVLIFQFLVLLVPIILAVAFLTLVERKVLAAVQRRRGPNYVGFLGTLQPFSDGLKLILKEVILPVMSDRFVFLFAPFVTFFLSLSAWSLIPFSEYAIFVDSEFSVLFLLAISSLSVYGIIFAGWSSNSRYAFLGSLRSAAQMVSYEVSIGLILLVLILCVGSLNLIEIVMFQTTCWFIIPFFPLFLMYFISALAETNRPPFDLPEAEGELVAGYSVEYSAVGFALFFIAEYANIILQSLLIVIFFFGGWLPFSDPWLASFCFSIKALGILFLFILVRAAYPRYRYDQLMRLGWKVFLPLALSWVLFVSGLLVAFDFSPFIF